MTDGAFEVRWRGIDGKSRKYCFEPTCSGHLRIEYAWTGARWRPVGREPVEDVTIETADGIVEADDSAAFCKPDDSP